MALPVLTANSPAAGYIAWTSFGVRYGDQSCTIAAGNSSNVFVYWLWNNGVPSSTLSSTNSRTVIDGLNAEDLVLFINRGGTPLNVQTTKLIEGSLVVSGSIVGDAVQARTLDATKIIAETLTSNEVKAGSIDAYSLSISSYGANVVINGAMDDLDAVTSVPAGWTAGFERTGTPTYAPDLAWPLIGSSSVQVTTPVNALEGLAGRATPCLAGDQIFFRAVFRASVVGAKITLRAYFGTTADFTRLQTVGTTPPVPENIYIADAAGPTLRNDLPTPLVGAGIAA